MFNLKGKNMIRTFEGAIISLVIFALTLSFSLLKFEQLINRKNPSINIKQSALDELAKLKIENDNHMMAFALEDFWSLTPIYDPNWLRLYAVRLTMLDGVWTEEYYPMQPCSASEFSKFYDYENRLTKMMVEQFR